MKMYEFRLRFHWSLFLSGQWIIFQLCFLVGDKPLSESMMVNLLTYTCVTRLQWVKIPGLKLPDLTLCSNASIVYIFIADLPLAADNRNWSGCSLGTASVGIFALPDCKNWSRWTLQQTHQSNSGRWSHCSQAHLWMMTSSGEDIFRKNDLLWVRGFRSRHIAPRFDVYLDLRMK